MARSALSARSLRQSLRLIHIVAGAVAAFLLYAPLVDAQTTRSILAFVLIPLLALSGVIMWQQAKLRRLFRGTPRRAH